MNHSFNVKLATKLNSVDKSVLLTGFLEIKIDWVECSAKTLSKLFPYFSPSKIQKMLNSLEKDGYLISSFSGYKPSFDRTKSYKLTKKSLEV